MLARGSRRIENRSAQLTGSRQRRGVATLWVLLAVPGVLTLLIIVTDVANMRLARIEAVNAVEAASLAAVKQWRDGGDTASNRAAARQTARAYAYANTVLGERVLISANQNTSNDNDNASISGNIVLGSITRTGGPTGPVTFNPSASPGPNNYGVHVQAEVPVPSLWNSFGGTSFGPYSVTVQATAWMRGGTEPQLIRFDIFSP